MEYTVAEVAEKLNISPHTVRYYHDQGLLPFVKRTSSGHRLFSETDIEMLQAVMRGRHTGGLSIREMKELVDHVTVDNDFEHGLKILNQHRNDLMEKISKLNNELAFTDTVIHSYEALAAEKVKGD